MKTWIADHLNRALDGLWGVQTSRVRLGGELGYENTDYNFYLATPWVGLVRLLRRCPIDADSVFIDVGCGSGRPLFLALLFPFKKVIGLERSAALCEEAEQNKRARLVRWLNGPARVEVVCADVVDYVVPAEVTHLYLACPFGQKTTDAFFARLAESPWRTPERYVIAFNAVHTQSLPHFFVTETMWEAGGGWYRIYRLRKR